MTDTQDKDSYRIKDARLVGREYNVTLSFTVEFNWNLLAGQESWQAIEKAKDQSPVVTKDPIDWDLVHSEAEAVRDIWEDDSDAWRVADWIDAPSAPSEETYWDDSKHFDAFQ